MVLRYFKESEFACKHCGESKMDPAFLQWLDSLRHEYGKPMIVTSGYRCPTHNQAVSSSGPDGPHTTGKAVDIGVSYGDAYDLVLLAMQMGVKGLGVNQKGSGRFVHLDFARPEPTIWSY